MPSKPKKPCAYQGCPNLTLNTYCEKHTKLMNSRYNKVERPYKSNERYDSNWRKIRNNFITQHPLCELCLRDGRYTSAEVIHHILPIEEGGTHIESNLMSLCKHCHSKLHIERGDCWHSTKRIQSD